MMDLFWNWCYDDLPNDSNRTYQCGSNQYVENDFWVDEESEIKPLNDHEEFWVRIQHGDDGVEDGIPEEK